MSSLINILNCPVSICFRDIPAVPRKLVQISWLWHLIQYLSIPLYTKQNSDPNYFQCTHCKLLLYLALEVSFSMYHIFSVSQLRFLWSSPVYSVQCTHMYIHYQPPFLIKMACLLWESPVIFSQRCIFLYFYRYILS